MNYIKESLDGGISVLNDDMVTLDYKKIDYIERDVKGGNKYYISIDGVKYEITKWQAHKFIMSLGFKECVDNSKCHKGYLLYEKGRGGLLKSKLLTEC